MQKSAIFTVSSRRPLFLWYNGLCLSLRFF